MKFIKKAVGLPLTAVFAVSAFLSVACSLPDANTPFFVPVGVFSASALIILILFFRRAEFCLFFGTGTLFLSLFSLAVFYIKPDFVAEDVSPFGSLAIFSAAAAFLFFLIYAIFRPVNKGDKEIDKTAFEDIY